MIIKKFTGKTEKEATDAAKKELGDGIVIMNVRNVKKKGLAGIFGAKQTEVTVALEEEKETLGAEKKSAENAMANSCIIFMEKSISISAFVLSERKSVRIPVFASFVNLKSNAFSKSPNIISAVPPTAP